MIVVDYLQLLRSHRNVDNRPATKIAVIDVRHPNELACLKAIGAKILHLDPASKSLVGAQTQHISETAFDAHICNAKMGLGPLIDDVFEALSR
jgi:hypothetical protein